MNEDARKGGTAAGWVLIAAAVLAVGAMMHHPTGGGGSAAESAASIARVADLGRLVHGAVIVLLLVEFYGVAAFAQRRGLGRPLTLAGFIFFSAGVFAMLPAPIIDGFVLPDLAERAHRDPEALASYQAMMRFGFYVAVAFAKVSSALISLGMVLIALELTRDRAIRWVAAAGAVIAAPIPVALVLGALELDVHGMLLVVVAWSVWLAGLGILMVRGRV